MFYNPITKQTKSLYALKELLNASIPNSAEQVGDWYKLKQGSFPEHDETKMVAQGPIEIINDFYTQTYILIDRDPEEVAAERLARKKADRYTAVNNLIVEYQDHRYDANEQSQNRMARAVASTLDASHITWVDADNVPRDLTIADLKNILQLAVSKTAELWVEPYEEN